MSITSGARAEEAGLLADVLAHPGDDFPRLAYADWCEDNGRDARAELVRTQCEMAREGVPQLDLPAHPALPGAAGRLRAREAAALAGCLGEFEIRLHAGTRLECYCMPRLPSQVRRGFFAVIRADLGFWTGGDRGRRILGLTPVERVEAADRRPADFGIPSPQNFAWWDASREEMGHADELPGDVWALLPRDKSDNSRASGFKTYPTAGRANDALSAALLALARGERRAA